MKKNKIFPKIKKKLTSFLTDESWKIAKKDALGLSAWALLLSAASGVEAAYIRTDTYTHNITPTAGFYPTDAEAYQSYWDPGSHSNTATNTFVIMDGATCNHSSGVVNGHYSSTPAVNASYTTYEAQTIHTGTSTHSSHSSHGSWGWC